MHLGIHRLSRIERGLAKMRVQRALIPRGGVETRADDAENDLRIDVGRQVVTDVAANRSAPRIRSVSSSIKTLNAECRRRTRRDEYQSAVS